MIFHIFKIHVKYVSFMHHSNHRTSEWFYKYYYHGHGPNILPANIVIIR